jgi:uncharacterized protein (DUF924 family)
MDPRIDEVIEFWFGITPEKWFAKDPAFDDEIRQKFGSLQAEAAAGAHDDWRGTPRGDLALLVLLDQFPRNLFRGDAKSFATDAKALAIAETMSREGLTPLQVMVSLIPYQHVEDLALQNKGIDAYEALAAAHPENKMLSIAVDFAKQHRDIIARFSRFPHRNTIVGRESTPEEIEFLKQPGSSF